MTIRQTTPLVEGKEQVDTGYDTTGNDPSSFYIPSCGIEDVDTAMVNLFESEIKFKSYQQSSAVQKEINVKKPFVIFATGERFALAKRLKPFRDRNGLILLPAVSIRRTTIEQQGGDVFLGEMTIKRRLDESDGDYQKLINRLALKNVDSLIDTTRSNRGKDKNLQSIREGMLLDDRGPLKSDHVYEIVSIPFPQFFTATYDVVFWSSYTQHMNYMIETLLSSQIVPGKGFYLKTDKGYWFNASIDNSLTAQDNAEDITDSERLIKYSFKITVRGFLLAPQGPGQRVPFKRYLSSVNVAFETYTAEGVSINEQTDVDNFNQTKNDPTEDNQFVLSDIQQDTKTQQKPPELDKYLFKREYRDYDGQLKEKTIKQMSNNQKKGETVYTASDLKTLLTFFSDR
jgi:hypothetical protein